MFEAAWDDDEVQVLRRVFPSWSVVIPGGFSETFVAEGYWHGWDAHRSISMTSLLVMDGARPVTAAEFLERLPEIPGTPIDHLPPGVRGVAVTCPSTPPARASMLLSAILVTDGRVLLVTITADDLDWASRVFESIRTHPAKTAPIH